MATNYVENSFGDLVRAPKPERQSLAPLVEPGQLGAPPKPRSSPFSLAPPQKPPKGWDKLAQELGVAVREDPQTRRLAFERFLDSLGCRSFKLGEVEAWLTYRAEEKDGPGAKFRWYGLREGKPESDGFNLYRELVPLEVLTLVAKVSKEYEATAFFVSWPERFLKVVLDGALTYVVAYWAEPGFGG